MENTCKHPIVFLKVNISTYNEFNQSKRVKLIFYEDKKATTRRIRIWNKLSIDLNECRDLEIFLPAFGRQHGVALLYPQCSSLS